MNTDGLAIEVIELLHPLGYWEALFRAPGSHDNSLIVSGEVYVSIEHPSET